MAPNPNTPNIQSDLQKLKIERNLLASLVKKLKNTETCLTLADLQSEARKLEIDRSGLACEIDRIKSLIEEERKKTAILKSVIKEKDDLRQETNYLKKDLIQKLGGNAKGEEVKELRARVRQSLFQVGSVSKEQILLKRELEEKEAQMAALTRQLLQLQSEVIFYKKERIQMDLLMNTEEEAKVILGRLRQANMEVEDQLAMFGRRVDRMKANFLQSGRDEVTRKSFAITGNVPKSAPVKVHEMKVPSEVSTEGIRLSGPGEPPPVPKYAMVNAVARVPSEYTISDEAIKITPFELDQLITPVGDNIFTIFTAGRSVIKSITFDEDEVQELKIPQAPPIYYGGEDVESEASNASQISSYSKEGKYSKLISGRLLEIQADSKEVAKIHDEIIRLKRKMIDRGDMPLLKKRIEYLSTINLATLRNV